MNASGEAVLSLLTTHRIPPGDLLVVFDDADLPLGRLRFRAGGSSGGHKGVQSVIDAVGPGFHRLKMGIGKTGAEGALKPHVLGHFTEEEGAVVEKAVSRAAEGIACFLELGSAAAMEQYNRKDI
jgi:PTH1 family peptidyl-tRNA hydrolase